MRQTLRRDAYDVIGVRPGATDVEVKRAFRERVKETHPDLSGGRGTQEEFLRLVEAYRETEVGRAPEQPFIEPPTSLREKLGRKLVEKKWWLLAWSVLAIALIVRLQPPTDEPVAHDEPVRPKAAARVEPPKTIAPVWTVTLPDISPLVGRRPVKTTRLALPRGEPQLPDALRQFEAGHPKDASDRKAPAASETDATPTATVGPDPANASDPPDYVSVMPPRRPRHLGEAKKHHQAPSEPETAETNGKEPQPAAANPDPSLLDRLHTLLGLR